MVNPKHTLRLVVMQHSYRMANRLRQMLVLAEYQRRNIFEVIAVNELLHILRRVAPIHLAILTPAMAIELERGQFHKVLRAQFPRVAILCIWADGEPERHSQTIIMPDYLLMPPITAESLDTAIETALENRQNRIAAAEHITWGEAAIKQGVLAEAQTSFEAAVRIGGPDPYPCLALGDLFAVLGNHQRALAYFTQAWEKDPTYFEAVRRVVEILLSQGERAKAIPYLERAAREGSAPVESLVLLGALYLETGAVDQATSQIRAAYRRDMSRAGKAVLEQARSLTERQASNEAVALLRIGIGIQPDNPSLYEALGDRLLHQNRFREALVCFETHMRLGDPLPAHFCRLARLYMTMGFRLRAEKAVERALNLDPHCSEAAKLHIAVAS